MNMLKSIAFPQVLFSATHSSTRLDYFPIALLFLFGVKTKNVNVVDDDEEESLLPIWPVDLNAAFPFSCSLNRRTSFVHGFLSFLSVVFEGDF